MTDRSSANILVVDDRPENLLTLEEMLAPLGQNVVTASSGEGALRSLLQQDFAVILLDVRMPGMDGFETAQHIKQRERTKHVPIIFLTAFGDEPDQIAQSYSAGGVDYMAKPYDPWVLRSKVAVFLDLWFERQRAQELSRRLSEAELRRRHALELNDGVVQGLTVAKYAFELGEEARGRAALEQTLREAKRIISDMLAGVGDDPVRPGDLVRDRAARSLGDGDAPDESNGDQ